MASVNRRQILWGALAVATTAVLVYFGTGLFPKWPLLWLAPLPILLFAQRNSWWATGLCAFAGWGIGALNTEYFYGHILQLPSVVRAEIIGGPALIFALSVMLFRALFNRGRSWAAILAFPALATCLEYAVNLTSPHGTFGSLAYSQLNFLPFLQLASITGPWGMTFFLLLFSSGIAASLGLRRTSPKHALRILLATAGSTVVILAFGMVRLAIAPAGPLVKVGLIASDLPQNQGVLDPGAPTERLLREYAATAETLAAKGAQVVVMPEKIGVIAETSRNQIDALMQFLADRTNAVIVVGVVDDAPPLSYNQARVYIPKSGMQTYAKHHMLPPFESRFKVGTTLTTFDQPSGTWAVEICKDMDFTQLSRKYGQRAAGLLLVPAWDFVLDRFQHGHIAVMRGVEDGFSIARAAKQGYLTVSDNRGRILAETQSDSASFATVLVDVPAGHDKTIYLKFGDWFPWLAVAILAVALTQLLRPRKPLR